MIESIYCSCEQTVTWMSCFVQFNCVVAELRRHLYCPTTVSTYVQFSSIMITTTCYQWNIVHQPVDIELEIWIVEHCHYFEVIPSDLSFKISCIFSDKMSLMLCLDDRTFKICCKLFRLFNKLSNFSLPITVPFTIQYNINNSNM